MELHFDSVNCMGGAYPDYNSYDIILDLDLACINSCQPKRIKVWQWMRVAYTVAYRYQTTQQLLEDGSIISEKFLEQTTKI